MNRIFLKKGRERALLRRHPWIFSGAIARVEGDPAPGATVTVCRADGTPLAQAAWSPHSQIRARVWTFDPSTPVDADFFRKRIRAALRRRASLPFFGQSDALRLIHAESDGIPGLIVDRYADLLVLQSLTAGSEFWKETLADILLEETGAATIYERSDADVRGLEGLPPINAPLRGQPPATLTIREHGLAYRVHLSASHKTGFYLDQRENRLLVRRLAADRDVLDGFSYTGGFTLNALAGGARSVLTVDASEEALALAAENLRLNGLADRDVTLQSGDAFKRLRRFRDEGRRFDLIVLDPPKFAPTAAHAQRAARGYKDINLLGFKLLRPGGLLVTFSCSGGISPDLFQKIVAGAALDAGVQARIVAQLHQSADHPIALTFPEGAYLKGLVCQI